MAILRSVSREYAVSSGIVWVGASLLLPRRMDCATAAVMNAAAKPTLDDPVVRAIAVITVVFRHALKLAAPPQELSALCSR